MGCIPTGHITVATASCPRARIPPEGNRAPRGPSLSGWHSLPRRPGTFARWSHQTLMQCSPPLRGALPWFPPRWPFVLRSYLVQCTFIHCLGAATPKSAVQLFCRCDHQPSCRGQATQVGAGYLHEWPWPWVRVVGTGFTDTFLIRMFQHGAKRRGSPVLR